MSKARRQVLARVSLLGCRRCGFHTRIAIGASRPRGPRGRDRTDNSGKRRHMSWNAYPHFLAPGDNAWQLTAATLVGLMSLPGLAVLYGGVMQKRWSVNSMILAFATFSVVLIVWVIWGFKMGFGTPWHGLSHSGFFGNFIGKPGPVLSHSELQG